MSHRVGGHSPTNRARRSALPRCSWSTVLARIHSPMQRPTLARDVRCRCPPRSPSRWRDFGDHGGVATQRVGVDPCPAVPPSPAAWPPPPCGRSASASPRGTTCGGSRHCTAGSWPAPLSERRTAAAARRRQPRGDPVGRRRRRAPVPPPLPGPGPGAAAVPGGHRRPLGRRPQPGRPHRDGPLPQGPRTEGRAAVGDEFVVRMPGPWDGPVRAVEVTPTSFRLATLTGHLEAGQIEFRAADDGGDLVFTIESWARSGDRLSQGPLPERAHGQGGPAPHVDLVPRAGGHAGRRAGGGRHRHRDPSGRREPPKIEVGRRGGVEGPGQPVDVGDGDGQAGVTQAAGGLQTGYRLPELDAQPPPAVGGEGEPPVGQRQVGGPDGAQPSRRGRRPWCRRRCPRAFRVSTARTGPTNGRPSTSTSAFREVTPKTSAASRYPGEKRNGNRRPPAVGQSTLRWRKNSTAATRWLMSSSSLRPSFRKMELMCFSTARSDR